MLLDPQAAAGRSGSPRSGSVSVGSRSDGGEPRLEGGRYGQSSSILTMSSLGGQNSLYCVRVATQPQAWSVEALTAGLAGVVS